MNDRDFLNLIPRGMENAVPMKHLAMLTNLEPRNVRQRVYRLRYSGVPICSSCDVASGGYYLPNTADEAAPYIREQAARIKSSLIALKAVGDFVHGSGNGDSYD